MGIEEDRASVKGGSTMDGNAKSESSRIYVRRSVATLFLLV